MNYALVGPENQIIRIASDAEIDPKVQTKEGWRWLPYEERLAEPTDTQVKEVETTVFGTKVVYKETVRDKTAEELAEDAQRKIDDLANSPVAPLLLGLLTELRGKQLTANEWRDWIGSARSTETAPATEIKS